MVGPHTIDNDVLNEKDSPVLFPHSATAKRHCRPTSVKQEPPASVGTRNGKFCQRRWGSAKHTDYYNMLMY
ncbi:unnamed protein product [Penicillium roqueforti FM164]|uniref:Genomic scaffold, ProqFM164S01 n=1 Tax=Penicillium roqueforti (strain FM164) TaxID=1365484 RepID=W6PWY8_PENRF|nr:unnamed protein product [Penicillium roqueforti FM164]